MRPSGRWELCGRRNGCPGKEYALLELKVTTLHGFGWDVVSDKEVAFEVDLKSGKHTGGASPGSTEVWEPATCKRRLRSLAEARKNRSFAAVRISRRGSDAASPAQ